jgi:hypothetical protein
LEPDDGCAVIVYEFTVPYGGVKLIEAVVVVTLAIPKYSGGSGRVRIEIVEEAADDPVVLIATTEIVYVLLYIKPVSE